VVCRTTDVSYFDLCEATLMDDTSIRRFRLTWLGFQVLELYSNTSGTWGLAYMWYSFCRPQSWCLRGRWDVNEIPMSHGASSCFSAVRQIRYTRTRRSLPSAAREMLVTSLVHSRLDYCNSAVYSRVCQLATSVNCNQFWIRLFEGAACDLRTLSLWKYRELVFPFATELSQSQTRAPGTVFP